MQQLMNKISEKIFLLARPIAEEQGLSLWDVEYLKEAGQWFLRIYIDKPGGVSIGDCEKFSRAFDIILDESDPIPDGYVFEVSSAGAERELKRESDFLQFLGSRVEVKLYTAADGGKSFVGKLLKHENGDVTIMSGENERTFAKAQIAQVRLRIS
jgi:ribosome maturation factor RimP